MRLSPKWTYNMVNGGGITGLGITGPMKSARNTVQPPGRNFPMTPITGPGAWIQIPGKMPYTGGLTSTGMC